VCSASGPNQSLMAKPASVNSSTSQCKTQEMADSCISCVQVPEVCHPCLSAY
ncbi:hypothetical protein ElyMa_005202500, partial [Elysia marginata]